MKVVVKIFGVLQTTSGGDRTRRETEVDLPVNANPADLLNHLGLQDPGHAVMVMDGRILGVGDKLQDGKTISIFPVAYGG